MLDLPTTTAAQFYQAANQAAADAIRWGRDPHGQLMALLRRRDAETLRALAKARLRT